MDIGEILATAVFGIPLLVIGLLWVLVDSSPGPGTSDHASLELIEEARQRPPAEPAENDAMDRAA